MKKQIIAGLAMAVCAGMFSGSAMAADKTAEKQPEFGLRLGFVNCSGCNGALQIGGDYYLPMNEKDEVDLRLSFSSENSRDTWALSGNYIYNIPNQAPAATGSWYLGAGLGAMTFSSKTKLGINVMGGYKFANRASLEATYSYADADNFYGISAGYRF